MSARPLPQRLFALLGDGQLHSGEQLARRCAVSRSAVWKALSGLRDLGLEVESLPRRGYRLPDAVAPLDIAKIRAALPADVRGRVRKGECVWTTGSTNADLLAGPAPTSGHFDFRAAEYQSAGRGRRGRSWLAPPGGAICLSIGWSFTELPAQAGALSLAMGVCLLRALRSVGVEGGALKWPNDLVLHAGVLRKLAGILCELRSESGGPAQVVIGMGVNVALGRSIAGAVARSGTQPASLADLGFIAARRNELLAAIVSECVRGLLRFEREGFAPFVAEWRAADSLRDAPVAVHAGASVERGIARGIDADGALLVDIGNSRIKWARQDARGVGAMQVIEARAATSVRWAPRLLRAAQGVERVIAVNVAGAAAARALRAATRAAGLPPPHFATSQKRAAGVLNGYTQPWRLGADRWVAVIAARHLAGEARAACVIDAGTALTIDLVDRGGRHRGGLIAPGAQLMVDSLLRNTQGIQRRTSGIRRSATRGFFARNTLAALQQGAIQGSAALIERAIEHAATLLGERPLVLLTGGGAPALHRQVRVGHRLVPDLVLQGLAVLAATRL